MFLRISKKLLTDRKGETIINEIKTKMIQMWSENMQFINSALLLVLF